MHAIVAREAGGPDVLELREVPDPTPGPGELLVRVEVAGVNFIDTYQRSGVYPMDFPHVVGSEGAGVVVAAGTTGTAGSGDETPAFAVGDRVVWTDAPGSYAGLVVVPARSAVHVPAAVALADATAVALQGLTAHYLCTSSYPVRPGDQVLVHAGAGGVGLLLTQMVTARGGHVISTVSTPAKAELSRGAGAEHVIEYTALGDLTHDLPEIVRGLTGGEGVAAVYDSVGRDTFDASLASLRRRGTLVLFGGSSGQVPAFDPQRLNAGGSLTLTRPTLKDFTATRAELDERAAEVLGAVAGGTLHVRVGATFPLAEAADAHRALEGRATTGKVLLVPDAASSGSVGEGR
ncbi:quinone oxidoreductase family protein [Cellulosimicrobium arenosum]|uniref:Quinone oxidoreductase n=1 Tax=Cellulosimicrobium arenosum TaxID=2708133 RepID=A0A927J040_9MICO|nr:quinone oxidoreductase [Cellulosimicrobium arenosum]MBD8079148.1 quinone oxidoreductase [Cellulosimicrobium arenosum]